MLSNLLYNLKAFALATPVNLLVLVIVCLIMKLLFKAKWKTCVSVIISYLLIGVLLALFGVAMPNFITLGTTIVIKIKEFFQTIW